MIISNIFTIISSNNDHVCCAVLKKNTKRRAMSAQVEEKVKQGGAIAGLGKNCSHHHRS